MILDVQNLTTTFFTKAGDLKAVDNISYSIRAGKTLGVVGESGCGKSVTSLSVLRLIESPGKITSGKIMFKDQNLLDLSEKKMQKIRGNSVAMIFQEPMTALNPVYTIGDQVSEVFLTHRDMTKEDAWGQSIDMLKLVGIPSPEQRVSNYPHQLSGGMRQRAMIAMALACRPALLIADEPTTALDVTIQDQILELMCQLQEELGMSIQFITHDLGVVSELSDDVIVMYAGTVVEKATANTVFTNPKHPYTLGLMESIPSLEDSRDKDLYSIPGVVPSLLNLPRGCRFQDRCRFATDACRETEPQLEKVGEDHFVACFNPVS